MWNCRRIILEITACSGQSQRWWWIRVRRQNHLVPLSICCPKRITRMMAVIPAVDGKGRIWNLLVLVVFSIINSESGFLHVPALVWCFSTVSLFIRNLLNLLHYVMSKRMACRSALILTNVMLSDLLDCLILAFGTRSLLSIMLFKEGWSKCHVPHGYYVGWSTFGQWDILNRLYLYHCLIAGRCILNFFSSFLYSKRRMLQTRIEIVFWLLDD